MKEKIITIKITEESKAIRDGMLAQDLKAYQVEGKFEKSLEDLENVKAQEFPEGVEVRNKLEKEVVDGFNVYTFSKDEYENVILYIHGGAWVYEFFSNHATLCDDLVDVTNSKVYAPFYPLAPKYSYKDTYKMIVSLYDELLKLNKPIFVMGDSAGGNIAIGLMEILKDTNRKMPELLVPLSPCVDMSISNPEAKEIEKIDPLDAVYGCQEFGKLWAKGTDLKDPLLSPLYADLKGYPKTLLVASTNDILTPDIMKFYELMKNSNNDITLIVGEGLWHVFPSMVIPEREEFFEVLKEIIKEI